MEITTTQALDALRADYMQRVEKLAEELRPGFESGLYRGFISGDGEAEDAWPLLRLEDEVARRLLGLDNCQDGPTGESLQLAGYVLACSPSLEVRSVSSDSPEGYATMAAALDLIRVARARGWYAASVEEEPTSAELGLEAGRAA